MTTTPPTSHSAPSHSLSDATTSASGAQPPPAPAAPRRRLTVTVRGVSFLACGILAALSGVLFGLRNLLEVGLLLVFVPLAALALVGWRRSRLRVHRPTGDQHTSVGKDYHATLQVHAPDPGAVRGLVVEETLPVVLGSSPRFALQGRNYSHGGMQELRYRLHPPRRGRFRLGPLVTRVSDPLGLWEVVWNFPGTTELVVTPRLVALPELALYGRFPAGMRGGMSSWAGEDDASVREYHHGDSLRRVHWRATAKLGELMVRREVQPEQANATILLDDSVHAHRMAAGSSTRSGAATGYALSTELHHSPSFEDAVTICASLAVALTGRGYGVSVRTRSGTSIGYDRMTEPGPLLDALAEIELTASADADAVVGGARPEHQQRMGERGFGVAQGGSDASGVVIAIVARIDSALVRQLGAWGGRGRMAMAIVIGQALTEATAELTQLQLSNAGWRVLNVDHADQLPTAWLGVGTPVTGVRR